jgi:hypothetical protein
LRRSPALRFPITARRGWWGSDSSASGRDERLLPGHDFAGAWRARSRERLRQTRRLLIPTRAARHHHETCIATCSTRTIVPWKGNLPFREDLKSWWKADVGRDVIV